MAIQFPENYLVRLYMKILEDKPRLLQESKFDLFSEQINQIEQYNHLIGNIVYLNMLLK